MKHLKNAFAILACTALVSACSSSGDQKYQSTNSSYSGAADSSLPADASTPQSQQVTDIYNTPPAETVVSTETTTYGEVYTPPADTGNYTNIDYVVVEGDSLWKIARKHNTNVSKIKEANSMTTDVIRPGQTIKVPVAQ